MATPESIMIDNTKYVRADSVKEPDAEVKIAVLDRGFVYVGGCKVDGDFLTITNARNIRVWGTSKGLGELTSGPTSKTVTDKVGTVRVPMRALISLIDVEKGTWTA